MRDFLWDFAMLSMFMGVLILIVRLFSVTFGRKIRARTRYLLWVLILLRMCMPFLLPLPTLLEVPVGDVERYQIIERAAQPDGSADISVIPYSEYRLRAEQGVYNKRETMNSQLADGTLRISRIDLFELLPGLWLFGAAVYLAVNLTGYRVYMSRLRFHFVPASESVRSRLRQIGSRMGVSKVPDLYVNDRVHSPMLCGLFKSKIVLPQIELTEEETAGILTHELTHYRRHDLWIQFFGLLVCTLHWFNPFVHLADRWMREEMELSCDEAVLTGHSVSDRSVYGKTMLHILRQCGKHPLPMTTHFSPGKRLMKVRFENIMDTSVKKRGIGWLAVILLLCVTAGSVIACVQETVPEPVRFTNLTQANVRYDSKRNLHQITLSHTDEEKGRYFSQEGIEQNYPWIGTETYIPVFANGSLLTDKDGVPALPAKQTGDGTYLVDVLAVLLTMYSDTGVQVEGGLSDIENGQWTACFSYRIDGKVHEVEIRNDVARFPKTLVTLDDTAVDISFTMERRTAPDEGIGWRIWVTAEDAAMLLGAEYAMYNTGPYSYTDENGERMLYYPFGEPYYLSNEPHLVFWRYPKNAPVLTEEEALDILETQLTQAYENRFGTFVALEEEPASSPYPGDEVMFRWKIAHLEIGSENDRFYRIPFVWDFLVDKYTGEIIVHYNGIDQSFNRFNPESPGALAFAG